MTAANVRRIPSDPNLTFAKLAALSEMSSDASAQKWQCYLRRGFRAARRSGSVAIVCAAMAQNSKTAGRRILWDRGRAYCSRCCRAGDAGEAVNTTKAMIQAVTGQTSEYTAAQRQRIYQDIARALTEKSRERAYVVAGARCAMKGQALTDTQTDQLAKMVAGNCLWRDSRHYTTRGCRAPSHTKENAWNPKT